MRRSFQTHTDRGGVVKADAALRTCGDNFPTLGGYCLGNMAGAIAQPKDEKAAHSNAMPALCAVIKLQLLRRDFAPAFGQIGKGLCQLVNPAAVLRAPRGCQFG